MSRKDASEQAPTVDSGLNKKGVSRRNFIKNAAIGAGAVAVSSSLVACAGDATTTTPLTSSAWKFGVMADTQWTGVSDDGYNPNTSAVSIATQIQQQFIDAGVEFVIHVGDLCDSTYSSTNTVIPIAGEDTRALFAQPLYNAGIGFFPLRGNHDDSKVTAAEFQRLYPQTGGTSATAGVHNASPSDITGLTFTDASVVSSDKLTIPSKTNSSTFTCGSNFSSPDPYSDGGLKGLSYSFDVNNARFIMLDQFTPTTGSASYSAYSTDAAKGTIAQQQSWISSQLSSRASGSHAFVFGHKGFITMNHADGIIGATPNVAAADTDAFINSMASNNVTYYINGHDHMHDRSLVYTSDGAAASIMQILCASNSSKFYYPAGASGNQSTATGTSSNDVYYNVKVAGKAARRKVVAQELFTVGFYIFTVDDNQVTVDYCAADLPTVYASASEYVAYTTQGLNFIHRERFGYSLGGKKFVIASGSAYTTVTDTSSNGTVVKVLDGTANTIGAMDANGLAMTRFVTTGWTSKAAGAISDILSIRGIAPSISASSPDSYVLSLYGTGLSSASRLAALDDDNKWVNAVDLNNGGTDKFVNGAYKAGYSVGTYGIDTSTNTVWAVLNYDGRFAIVNNL